MWKFVRGSRIIDGQLLQFYNIRFTKINLRIYLGDAAKYVCIISCNEFTNGVGVNLK